MQVSSALNIDDKDVLNVRPLAWSNIITTSVLAPVLAWISAIWAEGKLSSLPRLAQGLEYESPGNQPIA